MKPSNSVESFEQLLLNLEEMFRRYDGMAENQNARRYHTWIERKRRQQPKNLQQLESKNHPGPIGAAQWGQEEWEDHASQDSQDWGGYPDASHQSCRWNENQLSEQARARTAVKAKARTAAKAKARTAARGLVLIKGIATGAECGVSQPNFASKKTPTWKSSGGGSL